MDIRRLYALDIPKAKRLWKQAFSDTDCYINFNFEKNLSLENSVSIFENDELVCMLFMIPKIIRVNNQDIKSQFIAGVSTDNEYRYKGYAKKLMQYTHNMLKDAGYPFVFLYPFNHDFYRKLGYQTINHMNKVSYDSNAVKVDGYNVDTFDSLSDGLQDRVLDIYKKSCEQHDSYFIREKLDFSKMLKTLFVDDGKVKIVKQDKKDVGYVSYYLAKDKIECAESVFLDKEAVKAYMKMVDKSGFVYCDQDFEFDNSKIEEYAMVNIFDKDYDFLLKNKVLILEQY